MAALFILVAVAAAVTVSTTSSAKSPGDNFRNAPFNPSLSGRTSEPGSAGRTPVNARDSFVEAKLLKPAAGQTGEVAPTLTTDKGSYEPGETITFTGGNWQSGEVVTIVLREETSDTEAATLQANADDSGSFIVTGTMPEPVSAVSPSASKSAATHAAPSATESSVTYTATATGASSGVTAQAQFQLGPDAGVGDDPDLPGFMAGRIEKENYLQRRTEWVNRRRGVEPGVPFDPGARGRAIREMNQQEGRPDNTTNTFDPGYPGISSPTAFGNLLSLNTPTSSTVWSSIGPAPLPNGQTFSIVKPVSGRTAAIALHPTNSNIAYVGAAQGGVYRTLDGGATWTPLFDNAQTLSIGAIAIAPSQPSTIYVGTGEGNFSGDCFFGVGIYRIDNADTSNPIMTGPLNKDANGNDMLSGWGIDKIIVHPTDPNTIFFGTTSGIGGVSGDPLNDTTATSTKPRALWRSTNAASANPTFQKLTAATDNGGNLSVTDVEFEPGNPNTVLACVRGTSVAGSGGVYRSTNALAATPTFTRTLAVGSSTVLTRTEIAINKVGSQVTVYAATTDSSGTLKRSTDGGVTWSAALSGATGFCGQQCDYDMPMALDPTNANVLYLGGPGDGSPAHIMIKSTNALSTASFSTVQNGLHADEHAIEIYPSNTSIVWTGNDGGIFKSTDGAATWNSLNNSGYNATQFQSLALHPTDANFTIGGTQDNGTECQGPCGTFTGNTWNRADYGDGGFALIDQNATNLSSVTMYHTYYNQTSTLIGYAYVTSAANAQSTSSTTSWSFNGTGGISTCTNGGGFSCSEAVEFYAPMALGPLAPTNPLYFGTDRLHRWTSPATGHTVVSQAPIVSGVPISAIGISPQSDNVRIVGLENGQVWRTMTGSSTLVNVTGTIPSKYVSRVVVDPNNQNTAYVALSGYFGTSTAHIYKTTNLNAASPTWAGIDGGQIPDIPVNAFVVDPADSNKLYAGTDIGVYRSLDAGATWAPFSNGLPRVAVFDMAIQNPNRILRIATHGRGMWEISLNAPVTPGTLQGTVTNSATSAPINGATVAAGANTTTTNASGFYQFTNLTPSTYSVTASAPGYNSSTASGVVVTSGNTTTQNFALTPAPTSGCLTDTTQADFQAGIATNVDLTTSAGNVTLAAGAQSLDQSQQSASNFGFGLSTTSWVGQTFTPAITGKLTELDFHMFNNGGVAGNVVVEIRTTSGSLPTNTILASATIAGSTVGTDGNFPVVFSSPASLNSGTSYAFTVRMTSGSGNGVTRSSSNAYANGTAVTSTNSGGSWATQSQDLVFQTFMSIGFTTSGDLVSSVKDSNPAAGANPNWTTLSWTATTPANTTLKFQAAGSNSASGPFNFVGPDGTASTFFTTSGASLSQFNGNRYLKYKAFLSTTNSSATPTLNDATVCFSNGALPSTSLAVSSASGTFGGTTTLSATLTSGGNGVSGKTVSFSLNGNSAGSAVTNASGVASLSNVSLAGINAGSYPNGVGASFAGDGSYTSSAGSNSLTVSKATPTITWSNPANIIYGTALGAAQLNATASVPGSFVYTPAAGVVLNAGNSQNLHVDFTPTDTTNYNNASKDVSINVTKAVLTITADNKSKSYREANPTLTYTPTGFVNGDTASVLSGAPSLTTTAATASNVGSYPISVTQGTLSATNYSFSFVNGTLTVLKATPVINWSNPADITYGTALSGTQLNATATNPNDGSSVAGNFTYNPASGTVLNAGNSQTLAANFAPTDTANYNAPSQKTVSLNVLKAALTVTADDKSRDYGDANPTFTASYSGFVNGDTPGSLTGTLGFATSATQSSPVGTYTITPSGQSSSNYTITFANGTLTIKKAPLTITAANASREYGDANPPFTGTLTGIKNGDNITASYSTSATQGSAVGTYTIEPSAVDSSPSTLGNYMVTLTNGALTITKAPLSVAAANVSREYGDANPSFSGTLSGVKNGDNITASYSTSATQGSAVGSYDIVPALSDPDSKLGNYNVTSTNGTLTITKADLSATAADKTREYGDANPAFTGTLAGIKNGDNITASYSTSATQASAAGAYAITPSLSDPTNKLGNYNVTLNTGTLTITKAALSVTAADASRTYGAPNPPFTGTLTGIKNGDNITASYSTSATAASPAGTYSIVPTLVDPTYKLGNYNVTINNGTLTVNKAVLTITADDKSKVYGEDNPALTYTPTGFVNGDTASVLSGAPSLTTTAVTASNVGSYPISVTQGTLSATNYSFTFIGGTLTITKRSLTITADDKSKVYGTANPTFSASLVGFANGDSSASFSGTLVFATAADATSPVGTYPIIPSGLSSPNYAITYVNGTLTVTKAVLTITADDKSKVYGAANPSLTFTPSGFVNGDTAANAFTGSPSLTTTAITGSAVGGYPITAAYGTLSSANYSFSFVAGTLTITKATLTVTAQDKSKVYGTANPPLTYTVTGFVNGDTQSGATSGQPYLSTTATSSSPVGGYPITATNGTLSSANYSFSFVNGTLAVTKAVLTITADNKSKLYGAAVPALTYTPTGFVSGDTSSVLSGAPYLSTGVTNSSNVGGYPISITQGTLSATNYSFSFIGGTMSVTPAPLTIKADDKSKQYSDPLPAFTATYTGFVLGQGPSALTGTLSFTTTATATSPANANGTPLGYPINVGGQTSSNYAITYQPGTLTVSTETTSLSYTGDSLVSPSKAGGSATIRLAALVTEEADGYLGNTLGGKTVKFSVYGSNDSLAATATGTISSTDRTATASVSLKADNYTVKLELVANNQYGAEIEDAIVTVVDPGSGITTGGGWINDPEEGRGNFGFTVKYVGTGAPQGNNLYVYRKTMDLAAMGIVGAPSGMRAYNVIFKSNAMSALTSKTTTTPKTATFSGKNTIKAVDRLTGITYNLSGTINYNFQVDVSDKSEPSSSTNPDTYAMRVWTTTGNYKVIGTYLSTGVNSVQLPLQGGNVQVK